MSAKKGERGKLWKIQLPGYLPISEGRYLPSRLHKGRERVSAKYIFVRGADVVYKAKSAGKFHCVDLSR